MISHSQIYRARAALATHFYADQSDDYYSRGLVKKVDKTLL